MIRKDGTYSKLTDYIFELYEGFEKSQVFGRRDNQIYSIKADGSITLIGPSEWTDRKNPIVSPDQKWLLLLENQNKVALYSTNSYKHIETWEIGEYIYQISWRADSRGVFLLTEKHIYYLSMPNGKPIRLQECSPIDRCMNREMIWLP